VDFQNPGKNVFCLDFSCKSLKKALSKYFFHICKLQYIEAGSVILDCNVVWTGKHVAKNHSAFISGVKQSKKSVQTA
jgi:hypothetical protein